MSETIDYETREYAVHHISCDECGKHICDSEEYDDGYYEDPSEYEKSWNLEGWYYYRANLCKECAAKKDSELLKLITDFGFKKDRY